MNRAFVLLLLAILLGAGLYLVRFWPVPESRVAASSTPDAASRGDTAPLPGLGVSSCAAAACHHANQAGQTGSEYTTWATRDPHAQAFAVLFDDRSRTIQDNLNKGEPPARRVRADQNPLCLRCHAPAGLSSDSAVNTARLRDDGVGCESCHGAAEPWRDEHFRRERWKPLDAEKKTALGFRSLSDLHVRAEVCVGCHVGGPGQEVDHDLIAAGHPRLQFEFSSYLAALPAHWTEKGDNARRDFPARAWAAGQIASARSDLRLLAEQASVSERPWPEFAAHDCLACHHDLASPRSSLADPRPRNTVPGSIPANTWYFALLQPLTESAGNRGILLDPLTTALARPLPDRGRIALLADSNSRQLASVHPPVGPDVILAVLERALAGAPGTRSWDDVSQAYLALGAWRRSVVVGKGAGEVRAENAAAADRLLRDFRAAFPAGSDSPRGSAADLERRLRELVTQLKKK